ncbi:MAG: GNAT family N-acetyltransferase [Propionibacteriaceae bacterium]|nr:GNAT family N-acetyltransferase [Propionibacteriaceae bacterium]
MTPEHHCSGFVSGSAPLDSWLRNRAHKNEASGASRTFVTCAVGHDERAVLGYYTLAASSVVLEQAPGSVRGNMPDPIPVILLGRLAVDQRCQGAGLGSSLLRDAILRVAGAANSVGIRALLVHAIDDAAAAFYRHCGFVPSPIDDQTLFLTINQIRASAEVASS